MVVVGATRVEEVPDVEHILAAVVLAYNLYVDPEVLVAEDVSTSN